MEAQIHAANPRPQDSVADSDSQAAEDARVAEVDRCWGQLG